MALKPDGSPEHASVASEVETGTAETGIAVGQEVGNGSGEAPSAMEEAHETHSADRLEPSHVEEVSALLGVDSAPSEISDPAPAKNAAAETQDVPRNSVDTRPLFRTDAQPSAAPVEFLAIIAELKRISDVLTDSLADTRYISSRIDAISTDTERLIKDVGNSAFKYEHQITEMEALSSDAGTRNSLSKAFLVISSAVLVVLVVFQIYMFVCLTKIQQLQNVAGSAVLEKMTGLDKKLADYDRNLAKALDKPAQQDPASAIKAETEVHGAPNTGTVNGSLVLEKLNKLRNGLAEKKLVRKETGDWYVPGTKTQECIADVDVIDALNQAYRKIGRQLPPSIPMPPHNALCILKPNGKGGTDIVMTKEFLP